MKGCRWLCLKLSSNSSFISFRVYGVTIEFAESFGYEAAFKFSLSPVDVWSYGDDYSIPRRLVEGLCARTKRFFKYLFFLSSTTISIQAL